MRTSTPSIEAAPLCGSGLCALSAARRSRRWPQEPWPHAALSRKARGPPSSPWGSHHCRAGHRAGGGGHAAQRLQPHAGRADGAGAHRGEHAGATSMRGERLPSMRGEHVHALRRLHALALVGDVAREGAAAHVEPVESRDRLLRDRVVDVPAMWGRWCSRGRREHMMRRASGRAAAKADGVSLGVGPSGREFGPRRAHSRKATPFDLLASLRSISRWKPRSSPKNSTSSFTCDRARERGGHGRGRSGRHSARNARARRRRAQRRSARLPRP